MSMTTNPIPASSTKTPHDLRSRVERAAQSLRATAAEGQALEESALRLTSAANDGAALGQQLSAAVESIAVSAEETAVSTAKIVKSQQGSAELTQAMLTGIEESASALTEVAASVAG